MQEDMFTGIIETWGEVKSIEAEGSNIHFVIESAISHELKVDQSVAHDGVCLTVTDLPGTGRHRVTAIAETLRRTNLGTWKPGTLVNIERAMQIGGRLDGHMVQGHVDTTAVLVSVTDQGGSWDLVFSHPESPECITVPKGSICVNGVSLTVVISRSDAFSVSIIPYTWEHTNLRLLKPGDRANVEFDILGKYIHRFLAVYRQ